ncbi:MAG: MAPEG family protein [Woeseiaceae bacterium]|nr:MAPEG family protein [Woeseiaceae bacterium]
MEGGAILQPFAAMLALTLVVWVVMYHRRLTFLFEHNIDPQSLTSRDEVAGKYPPQIAYPSDNLKNLFELPVLFYAVCLYLYVTGSVDAVHVVSAWVFAVFRVLHSAVHCTINIVKLRFGVYAVAAIALWVMVVRVVLDALL